MTGPLITLDPQAEKLHIAECEQLRAEVKAWRQENGVTIREFAKRIGVTEDRLYRFLSSVGRATAGTLQAVRKGFEALRANRPLNACEDEPSPTDRDAFVRWHTKRWMGTQRYGVADAAAHLWLDVDALQRVLDGQPADDDMLARLARSIRPLRIHSPLLSRNQQRHAATP